MFITLDILKQLFPIRTLSDDELSAFVLGRRSEVYERGTVLFKAGGTDRVDSLPLGRNGSDGSR